MSDPSRAVAFHVLRAVAERDAYVNLVLPAMLKAGITFWAAFAISVTGTALLYLLMFWLAPRLGLRL